MSTVITFTTARGAVTYTTKSAPPPTQQGGLIGGLLGGEPTLLNIVQGILAGNLPRRVRVAEPDLDYEFSPSRDTLADLAAAMLVAGNGRGRLSDTGWAALDAALEGAAKTSGPSPRAE